MPPKSSSAPATGHSTIARKGGDHVYLRLSLKTAAAAKRNDRPPINVARIVIDRS